MKKGGMIRPDHVPFFIPGHSQTDRYKLFILPLNNST